MSSSSVIKASDDWPMNFTFQGFGSKDGDAAADPSSNSFIPVMAAAKTSQKMCWNALIEAVLRNAEHAAGRMLLCCCRTSKPRPGAAQPAPLQPPATGSVLLNESF